MNPYQGPLYRALNPVWARDPLSGRGAETYGGRFNAKGVAALYTSVSIQTAIREANQVGDLQPTVLVQYRADIDNLFDSRDADALKSLGIAPDTLSDPGWRQAMVKGEAPSQKAARAIRAAGYPAMLVQSFARGATVNDLNIVLWDWGPATSARLTVIDDEQRLDSIPKPPKPR